jgi:N utilization substance protein A
MSEIMISKEAMQYIHMAGNLLKIDILDCIVSDDRLVFIVRKGQLGIAIGSKGKNLEKLRKLFKKNIKFVESDSDTKKFIHNLCKPYTVKDISVDGEGSGAVVKIQVDPADKSKLIGRGGSNIEIIRQLAQRHHSVKDVQIK